MLCKYCQSDTPLLMKGGGDNKSQRRNSENRCTSTQWTLFRSVQDLFDAPAAEDEVKALLDRLDETICKVSSQEVLASSQAHGHVSQVLSQRGGGQGLGKRTLGVHASAADTGKLGRGKQEDRQQ